MIEKTRAIVLSSIKYGESQFIVDLFTESWGRLSFMVRLPKSGKGKVKRQYFQPLTLLRIGFDYRPKLDLQKLQEASLDAPLMGITMDPIKISLALFLAEFLTYATRCEQDNHPLFSFIYNSILWLDGTQSVPANFHIVFMIHLSLFLGFPPNIEIGENDVYFDLQEGCFVPTVPTHRHFLSVADSQRLKVLFRLRYETMHLYSMSRTERNHCVEVILDYYRLHVPGFPEIKSLSVLRELFG